MSWLQELGTNLLIWLQQVGDSLYRTFVEKDRYMAFLKGIGTTLEISFFAVLLGTAIGVFVAVVKNMAKKHRFLRPLEWLLDAYVLVIRGTPVYVQLLILNTVVFASVQNKILVAVITFGINSGAYVAEIIRAGINSVDKGQFEAGNSLGLRDGTVMRLIILPQAVRNILPALGNEFITLVKETSIAGTMAVNDLTKAAERVGGATYDLYTPLLSIAVIYFVLVFGMTRLLNLFERRLAKSDNR